MDTTTAKRKATEAVEDVKSDVVSGAKKAARTVKQETDAVEANVTRGAEELAASVNDKLRSVGLDTDRMVDVAKEQASELQQLIEAEIRERPLRALGFAAAIGLFVGFLAR